MFINRTWTLDEETDFQTNVAPRMSKNDGATPIYDDKSVVVGWKIKPMYE